MGEPEKRLPLSLVIAEMHEHGGRFILGKRQQQEPKEKPRTTSADGAQLIIHESMQSPQPSPEEGPAPSLTPAA